jgi:ribose transport system permease protein
MVARQSRNCLASHIVTERQCRPRLVAGVLGTERCFTNGIVIGRLQPIVTTIATGGIYYGAAALRPVPGGDVQRRSPTH